MEIQKTEFGNFIVPVNNTLMCHTSSFVFLAADTLLYVLITLAIDKMDGRGHINMAHCESLPKKTKVVWY